MHAVCLFQGLYKVKSGPIDFELVITFTLPYTKQRWISCGVLLRDENVFICGDRGGSVHVYEMSDVSDVCETPISCNNYFALQVKLNLPFLSCER